MSVETKYLLDDISSMVKQFGLKSITMDDIASNVGISKKTLYRHFRNKEDLVDRLLKHEVGKSSNVIKKIIHSDKDPVHKLHLMFEYYCINSAQCNLISLYDLEKFYPKYYNSLFRYTTNASLHHIGENLKLGIQKGYYKSNINIDLNKKLIGDFFINVIKKKNTQLFNIESASERVDVTKFYLMGIVTPKGIKAFNEITKKQLINESI